MKPIKDKFVNDQLCYMVLEYLDSNNFKPIYDRRWEKYDEKTKRPYFKLEMLDYNQFSEIAKEAFEWYMSLSEEITSETLEKYL